VSQPTSDAVEERIVHAPSAAPGPSLSLRLAAAAPPATTIEEVVRVSIGRIEVRTAPPAAPPAVVALARPRQSLDEHLAARDRARR
jgi:hypothetical protein